MPAVRATEGWNVCLWSNGMVMVFDPAGDQMDAYQGHIEDVQLRVCRDAPADSIFKEGKWLRWVREIPRDQFCAEIIPAELRKDPRESERLFPFPAELWE
jgi:hypothetical protein